MADIRTILRELSVILGFILAKYKLKFAEDFIDIKTYLNFIKKYCKNIDECNSEIQKIEELPDMVIHKDIIQNGLNLGKLIYEKLNLEGDIIWLGAKVKSEYPFDIMIGDIGISLKEDSYILKNPSFSDYLNALVQPKVRFKHVHVFREFALGEFTKWFDYTFIKMKKISENFKINDYLYKYSKRGTYIKKGKECLIFGKNDKEITIGFSKTMDETILNSTLGGFIFEHTVSKWIKENLEKNDKEYERLKKDCSVRAGENLKQFIIKNLNLNTKEILELLQIYDDPYYYGKSYGAPHLYEVPSNNECNVKLIDIEVKVPKSQLNVYLTFDISNANGANNTKFRVECRYSHGQFKGIPEAKLYYTDNINHLNNIYKIIK